MCALLVWASCLVWHMLCVLSMLCGACTCCWHTPTTPDVCVVVCPTMAFATCIPPSSGHTVCSVSTEFSVAGLLGWHAILLSAAVACKATVTVYLSQICGNLPNWGPGQADANWQAHPFFSSHLVATALYGLEYVRLSSGWSAPGACGAAACVHCMCVVCVGQTEEAHPRPFSQKVHCRVCEI